MANLAQRTYNIAKLLKVDFKTAVERTTASLKENGFGIITTIDMKATFKAKIDHDIDDYVILGTGNFREFVFAKRREN